MVHLRARCKSRKSPPFPGILASPRGSEEQQHHLEDIEEHLEPHVTHVERLGTEHSIYQCRAGCAVVLRIEGIFDLLKQTCKLQVVTPQRRSTTKRPEAAKPRFKRTSLNKPCRKARAMLLSEHQAEVRGSANASEARITRASLQQSTARARIYFL